MEMVAQQVSSIMMPYKCWLNVIVNRFGGWYNVDTADVHHHYTDQLNSVINNYIQWQVLGVTVYYTAIGPHSLLIVYIIFL